MARAVTLQTKQAVTKKKLGRDELQPEVDDHGDRAGGHPGADQDADGQHDQNGRHGLADALDDALLHFGPGELEGRAQPARQKSRRDQKDLRLDFVDSVADAEQKGHGDQGQNGDAEGDGAPRGALGRRVGCGGHGFTSALDSVAGTGERAAGQQAPGAHEKAAAGDHVGQFDPAVQDDQIGVRAGFENALARELVDRGRMGGEKRRRPIQPQDPPAGQGSGI